MTMSIFHETEIEELRSGHRGEVEELTSKLAEVTEQHKILTTQLTTAVEDYACLLSLHSNSFFVHSQYIV